MTKRAILIWTLIAWPLPAVIAGGQGWKGIWGSGSALGDYLIPLPVAGGALHVPSFLLCTVALAVLNSIGSTGAARIRAFFLGLAATGVLSLLKLDSILLALQTGATVSTRVWQENPLGLFLACDGAAAFAFSLFAHHRPLLKPNLSSILLLLLPCAIPLALSWPRSADEEPFRIGHSRNGPSRGDEITMVFTRLPVGTDDFRRRAESWVAPRHPSLSVNAEDIAFKFTRDLDAARRFDQTKTLSTLCVYEDGTPSQWMSGDHDCFSTHMSFSDALAKAINERPRSEHPELRAYFAARQACREVPALTQGTPLPGLDTASRAFCIALESRRVTLRGKFPDNELLNEP